MLCQQLEEFLRRIHGKDESARYQFALMFRLYVHIVKGLTEMSAEVLREFELTPVSFSVLMMLHGSSHHAMNPSLACEMTGESRANMTRIGDDLLARGLIERLPSDEDRRRLVLSITAAGVRLVQKVLPRMYDRIGPAFADFNGAETKSMLTMLKRQLRAIEGVRRAPRHAA